MCEFFRDTLLGGSTESHVSATERIVPGNVSNAFVCFVGPAIGTMVMTLVTLCKSYYIAWGVSDYHTETKGLNLPRVTSNAADDDQICGIKL